MKLSARLFVVVIVITTCFLTHRTSLAQGVMLRGSGAVNEGVGGTATAMPLDAIGALLWNPASISALKQNEISFGLELIQPHSRVTTSGGTYYPPLPPGTDFNGSTKGETGVVPVPGMGFVWRKCPRSVITYGLGMSAVGGAAMLYPHDQKNLVLAEAGRSANVIVLQMTPTASVQLTERMSIGVAPIIDLASLNINPMSLGRDPNNPLLTYGTRYVWGGGFQIGALYDFQNHFKAGFMFKSPVWAEKLYFTGTNKLDKPDANTFQLNLPMMLSAGISYDGFRDTVIGMDVRYFDYANTSGFDKGLSATGNVEGLGWESIFAISVGVERKFSNRLKGRMGYCWNESPIPGSSAVLNVSAPLFTQHVLSFGFGYTIAKGLEVSAAYCHAFEAKCEGPVGRFGATVTNIMSADTFSAGISKKW